MPFCKISSISKSWSSYLCKGVTYGIPSSFRRIGLDTFALMSIVVLERKNLYPTFDWFGGLLLLSFIDTVLDVRSSCLQFCLWLVFELSFLYWLETSFFKLLVLFSIFGFLLTVKKRNFSFKTIHSWIYISSFDFSVI